MDSRLGAASSTTVLRELPSVSEVDQFLQAQGLPHGKPVRPRIKALLERFRAEILANPSGGGVSRAEVLNTAGALLRQPDPGSLLRVINATGVVVHTNLGRAPLSAGIFQGAEQLLTGYTNLEFDLATGKRGSRGGKVPELLRQLAKAEAALVVNNNAAAVLLLLSALAPGREVIVSRGELVEIGGSFRVPDIMRQSGARLVEVGTTNRTRLSDYEQAITENTVGLLKVHPSNFHMSGFVESTSISELAELARRVNAQREGINQQRVENQHSGPDDPLQSLQVWHDLGSGSFYRYAQPALQSQGTIAQELKAGADVLTFSGDKVLGAVQAGIAVGRAAPIDAMRRHPLYRTLRMDKVRLVLLEAALRDTLAPDTLRETNPVTDLLERTPEDMLPMVEKVTSALGSSGTAELCWEITRQESLPGGGALPEVRLPSIGLSLWWASPEREVESLAEKLREASPPIIAARREGRVLLDFRTLFEGDLTPLAKILAGIAAGSKNAPGVALADR